MEEDKRELLVRDIKRIINRHCVENASNTPDFILAEFAVRAIEAFSAATERREDWQGRPQGHLEHPLNVVPIL